MSFHKTPIEGLLIYEPKVFKDERGYFFESYNQKVFHQHFLSEVNFVQDNQSFSTYATLRGLHFQTGPHAQAKLVRVLRGVVYDVAVDLRADSPTFGKHYGVELSSENKRQFYIPRGFAHGFVVLSEEAEFFYKVDNFYNKESEGGIVFNDPDLNINWNIPPHQIKLSTKDQILPTLDEYLRNQNQNQNVTKNKERP